MPLQQPPEAPVPSLSVSELQYSGPEVTSLQEKASAKKHHRDGNCGPDSEPLPKHLRLALPGRK